MRIGHGFDVHAFGAGDAIRLGGIDIPYHQGFVAHSDGDVALHALCDALLGAAGLGDIGQHFPDNAEEFRGIDSRELLRRVAGFIATAGWQLGNADITIIAQAPKLAPHLTAMRDCIALDLAVLNTQINLKATTTEHLGYVGRGEGIAVHAVVLLQAIESR